MPMIPFFPFNRRNEPEFYWMTCPECGFAKEYELAKNYTVCKDPECDDPDEPEMVEELPTVCPKCGAKLKTMRLPVRIIH